MECDFWVTSIRSAGSAKKRKQAKLEVAFDGELEGSKVTNYERRINGITNIEP